jgi:MscS family membrane protein
MIDAWIDRVTTIEGTLWQVLGIVLLTFVLDAVLRLIFNRIARRLENTRNLWDDALLESARKPVRWTIVLLGVLWAAEVVGGDEPTDVFQFVDPIRTVGVIVLLAWFATRVVSNIQNSMQDARYQDHPWDASIANGIGRLLRVSIIIATALVVLQTLGISVSGVLAFGGIGGLAIGFAAQDLLANYFGFLMILFKQPFKEGDWIRSPDREIEGTVEEIMVLTTRIRTFDKRPLHIPNSVFTNLIVENPSQMDNRRIKETIGVRYDDINVLPGILEDIRHLLRNHDAIDTDQTLMVNLLSFGSSSVDFWIYTFTKTKGWTEFHEIKESILFEIASIIERHGAEIAFPTQTLHVEAPESNVEPREQQSLP